jgi:hypothetical protein
MSAAETRLNAEIAGSASNTSVAPEWVNPAWKDTRPSALTAASAILLVHTKRFTVKETFFQEKM